MVLYHDLFYVAPGLGCTYTECSWVLEDNGPMNGALERMGAVRDRVYRVYDRPTRAAAGPGGERAG
jgi:hypothetical protein